MTELANGLADGLSLPKKVLHELLVRMLRIRMFDEMASRVRSEWIKGPLHNSTGQEGGIVGACTAIRPDDYMTGTHRSHGHPIGKGARLAPLMAELFGRQTGICHGKGGSMHLADFSAGSLGESAIVGASMPTAVGAALSAQLRGTDQVSLCFFGDGAANCGLFHESINLAAIWKLPVIFLCENNQYAICTQYAQTTSVADIASRGSSYGIPGVIVDGQDVLAVHGVVSIAVVQARAGNGPTLIEAKTYRWCDHQEDYNFPSYREESEIAEWKTRDPIEIFAAKLRSSGSFTAEELCEVRADVWLEVEEALMFAQQSPAPEASALLADVFV
jgi:pyruvate dehydrogenase E1 component alpha subunit